MTDSHMMCRLYADPDDSARIVSVSFNRAMLPKVKEAVDRLVEEYSDIPPEEEVGHTVIAHLIDDSGDVLPAMLVLGCFESRRDLKSDFSLLYDIDNMAKGEAE